LAPLFGRSQPRSSRRWLDIRNVSGGLPAIAHTHGSHTSSDSMQRTRFWPVKLAPAHRSRLTPRVHGAPQIQQRNSGMSAHAGIG
jgi:hypothetical protein